MPELKDFLSSINTSKQNLIRSDETPDDVERSYVPFVVQRAMGSFLDTIMFANELNTRGSYQNLTNRQHYEFLLHTVKKGKRFTPWIKTEANDEKIQLIMDKFHYTKEKAEIVASLIPEALLKPNRGG